jgi:hypothetical protein
MNLISPFRPTTPLGLGVGMAAFALSMVAADMSAFGARSHGPAFATRTHTAATMGNAQPAAVHASLSTEFHRALETRGRWTTVGRFGEVWKPANVPGSWRPYRLGKWVYTDEWGWYWASNEDFGWITYHYGRWVYDPHLGWVWAPDDEWGPAWVRWRRGAQYVGWCPLPPDAVVDETDTAPDYWLFVNPADLLAPEIDTVVLPVAQTQLFIRTTVIVNQTVTVETANHVFLGANPGVQPSFIAAALKHPMPTAVVRPHVLKSTSGVQDAIVTRAGGRRPSKEQITRQARLIGPAESVPRPTRFRPSKAAVGPDTPNVLKHAVATSAKGRVRPGETASKAGTTTRTQIGTNQPGTHRSGANRPGARAGAHAAAVAPKVRGGAVTRHVQTTQSRVAPPHRVAARRPPPPHQITTLHRPMVPAPHRQALAHPRPPTPHPHASRPVAASRPTVAKPALAHHAGGGEAGPAAGIRRAPVHAGYGMAAPHVSAPQPRAAAPHIGAPHPSARPAPHPGKKS